jgi:hypothetical protein
MHDVFLALEQFGAKLRFFAFRRSKACGSGALPLLAVQACFREIKDFVWTGIFAGYESDS